MHLRLAALVALMMLVVAPDTLAFVDPPTIDQTTPHAGDLVTMSIRAGGCDSFHDVPNPLSVAQTGATIRVLFRTSMSSPPFCLNPTFVYPYNIGRFAAGTYSIQVDRTYPYIDGQRTETIATLPLVIAGAPEPAVIDTLSPINLGLLALVLAFVAGVGLRARRPHAAHPYRH